VQNSANGLIFPLLFDNKDILGGIVLIVLAIAAKVRDDGI
jgi:hypothetical protein